METRPPRSRPATAREALGPRAIWARGSGGSPRLVVGNRGGEAPGKGARFAGSMPFLLGTRGTRAAHDVGASGVGGEGVWIRLRGGWTGPRANHLLGDAGARGAYLADDSRIQMGALTIRSRSGSRLTQLGRRSRPAARPSALVEAEPFGDAERGKAGRAG